MLTFDEKDHIYRWNDVKVPSVTQVVGEWVEISISGILYYFNIYSRDVISMDKLRAAQDFGRAFHKAAYLCLRGTLDWEPLAPELIPPLKEFVRWTEEHQVKPLLIEKKLYSKTYGYAGTPDFIGYIRQDKTLSVVDYGTGAYGMKGPQTAAYEKLYREEFRYTKPMKRYVLSVPREGKYRFIPQEDRYDWMFFSAKLTEKKILSQKGVIDIYGKG